MLVQLNYIIIVPQHRTMPHFLRYNYNILVILVVMGCVALISGGGGMSWGSKAGLGLLCAVASCSAVGIETTMR